MWRCAFRLDWHPAPRCAEDCALLWRVAKCHNVRRDAEPYTLPVKIETAHGDKRLLVLSPQRLPVDHYYTPREALGWYLDALPVETKLARTAEMRAAFVDPTHPAPYTEKAA